MISIILIYLQRDLTSEDKEKVRLLIEAQTEQGDMKALVPQEYNTVIPHGNGVLVWPNGKVIYEGGFDHGKMHGKGRQIMKDGYVCDGDWQNGFPSGIVNTTYPNGDTYKGQMIDGVK